MDKLHKCGEFGCSMCDADNYFETLYPDEMNDLTIPAFLVRPRGTQPIQLTLANISRKRWAKLRTMRPEGDDWATATLRDVWLRDEAQPIGCGRRLVWVREGRKWCKLAALDGTKAKIPMAVWATIARRTVSS